VKAILLFTKTRLKMATKKQQNFSTSNDRTDADSNTRDVSDSIGKPINPVSSLDRDFKPRGRKKSSGNTNDRTGKTNDQLG